MYAHGHRFKLTWSGKPPVKDPLALRQPGLHSHPSIYVRLGLPDHGRLLFPRVLHDLHRRVHPRHALHGLLRDEPTTRQNSYFWRTALLYVFSRV